MDSFPIMHKLSHLIQVMGILAEKAIFYKSCCKQLAASISPLKILFEELQETKAALSIEDLSVLNRLEFTCLKMKELLESCEGTTSKSFVVVRKQKISKNFQELSSKLHSLLKSLPSNTLSLSDHSRELVEECVSSLQTADFHADALEEGLSQEVESALAEIKKGTKMKHGMLVNLSGKLKLKSNQEILREASLLEKEKNIAHLNKDEEEVLNLLIILVTQMGDDLAEQKYLEVENGKVSIPADFRCPLSLELMSDPVIVASGQTYERVYIQQWLDQGNTTCPKSRQPLNHLNLISNYTVRALIRGWCEQNGVSLPEPASQLLPSSTSNQNLRQQVADGSLPDSGHPTSFIGNRPTSVRSMRTRRSRSREHTDNMRETGSEVGNLEESRGFLQGDTRIQGLDIDCPLQDGVIPLDGARGHSRNGSTSSRGSSLDDVSTPANIETNSSLSSDFFPYISDVSGELSTLTVASGSVPSRGGEEAGSRSNIVNHGFSSRVRQAGSAGLEGPQSSPSAGDTVGEDGNDVQLKVRVLVEDLQSSSCDVQRNAATELRLLAKYNVENRIIIADSGAIPPLVSLLHSTDPQIQENAVTALLNLSINNNNKSEIASANAIGPLVHVLNVGTSEARENAAATLFSLSVMDENKMAIGQSGAIEPLVDLLTHGTPRGKKDAATALFNLSIHHENKIRIVRANAVRPLVNLMSDPAAGMVDKAVAVLANLATIQDGRTSIGQEEGIPALVEVVEMGSQRGKENAAAALLHLCTNSNRSRSRVLQEGVIPPLVALTKSGTARAKEKASALLRLFREQRQGRGGADMHRERRR